MVEELDNLGCLYLTVARIRWHAPILKVTQREVLDGQDDIKRNAIVKTHRLSSANVSGVTCVKLFPRNEEGRDAS